MRTTTPPSSRCELSVARPLFSREAWTLHPHYPDHVLLVGSHQNFKRISTILVERASTLTAPAEAQWRDETKRLFQWWQSGMRSHEHYEETKLYPYLEARYCMSLGPLVSDHGELDDGRSAVTNALTEPAHLPIQDALRSFHEVLVGHLQHEEDLVMPMLLELNRTEFQRFLGASPAELRLTASCSC
jgi:iron-sulfur cluster repair protein YtfE (RIC family)